MKRWKPRLPKWIRNPYLLLGMGFLIWVIGFDAEDLVTQYQLWHKIRKLEAEKNYYIEQIEVVKKERLELMTNDALLEKFAREKYYMKKPKEDIYVVVK